MICEIAYPRPERVYPHALLLQLKVKIVRFFVVHCCRSIYMKWYSGIQIGQNYADPTGCHSTDV
jgi:hypothetical protein